jgi:hypothetical protein
MTIILLFFAMACSKVKPVSERELNEYVLDEKNGLIQTVEENGLKITMTYRPSEFIAKQQIIKNTRLEYDSLNEYFSSYLYFLMEITYNNKDLETSFALKPSNFASNISYLSDKMGEDIKLVSETETLPIVDYVYARSYGVGPSQFLLAFEKPKSNQFQVEMKTYAIGIGNHSFSFNKKDLENRPHLKLY